MWQSCVWKICVWKSCVTKLCVKGPCDKVVCDMHLWQSCVEDFCAPPKPVQCHKCHACHAKWRPISRSARPATQSDGRCCQVPRLPRKQRRRPRRQTGTKRATRASQCHKRHACHAKWRSMSPSVTCATQSAGRCRQVPLLPRKQRRRPRRQAGTKRATSASPVPELRLPRKVEVDVAKCHACCAKWRSMSPSATPATQTAAAPTAPNGNQARHQSQPSTIIPRPPRKVEVDVAKIRQVPRLPHKVTI